MHFGCASLIYRLSFSSVRKGGGSLLKLRYVQIFTNRTYFVTHRKHASFMIVYQVLLIRCVYIVYWLFCFEHKRCCAFQIDTKSVSWDCGLQTVQRHFALNKLILPSILFILKMLGPIKKSEVDEFAWLSMRWYQNSVWCSYYNAR